jgi:putative DNA primase/helicase
MSNDDWLNDVSHVEPITPEGEVKRLAALSPGAYEKERKAVAKLLGWRTTVLDEAVEAARPKQEGEDPSSPFNEVEPWTSAVGGADLLDELRDTILRFCVMPDHSVEIVAVWIAHAWAHDASDISPILVFSSPEKRCGKTTALKVVAALAPRPLHSVNISTSVVFRVVEAHRPTLLIDEADTFLAANDELRGILNGGHDRLSAWVWRSTGDDHEPKAFNVWAPKAIAMIGRGA